MSKKDRDDKIVQLVGQCGSFAEIAEMVGTSHQTVSRVVSRLNLDISHFHGNEGEFNPNYRHGKHCEKQLCSCGRERDYRADKCAVCSHSGFSKSGDKLVSDEDMIKAVRENDTFLKASRSLGVTRQVVNRACERLGLDISHFRMGRGRPYTDEDLFRAGHKQRVNVRARFYKINPENYMCSVCGIDPLWNGKRLNLEVDHINGDRTDNRLENLRWICPNCHTQQPTAKGLNYHKYGNKRKSKEV